MKIQKFVILSLFCLVFSNSLFFTLANAQVEPSIEWKTWRLPYFDLIFDAKHQDVAELYAERLISHPAVLKNYFSDIPERTVFVIDDRTDLTNGYATAIPYRTIVIYPVLPGPQETISDFGDWARELSLHEYTHILSFEPRRSVVKALYYTFGNVITPNLLLPRWWLEGVAVDMETRTGNRGRLRSPFQDAAIRALAQNIAWQDRDISEINETSIHTWPQGARPYLYGSLMWSELVKRYGQNIIDELHTRYGGRVPFFIEAPLQEKDNGSYADHFDELKEKLALRVNKQKNQISTVAVSSGTRLVVKGAVETFYPTLSPDRLKLLMLSKDDANKRSVRILKRPNVQSEFKGSQELGEIDNDISESMKEMNPDPRKNNFKFLDEADQDAPPGGTIHRVSWFPDSQKFVFDKLTPVDRYFEYSDLYTYDLKAKKIDRLTTEERAREGAVSPDGNTVVFVKLGPAATAIGLLDITTKKAQIIYQPELQVRVSNPSFLDKNTIIFSERKNSNEYLVKFNLQSKQHEVLLNDYKDARFPIVTSQGVLFTSSKSGVPNSYLLDLKTGKPKPLTNTLTAVTSAALDTERGQLFTSELTATGFQITAVSLKDSEKLPSSLPQVAGLMAEEYPEKNPAEAIGTDALKKYSGDIEEFSAWPYIWPHYWLPNFNFYNGGAILGGSIAGSDPLAKHTYSAALAYDTLPKELSSQFIYSNNQTLATISVLGYDLKSSVPNTIIRFRQQHYQLQSVWELPGITPDLYAGVAYALMDRDYEGANLGSNTSSHGPALLALYSDIAASGAQIAPEAGIQVKFQATHFVQNSEPENEPFTKVELSFQKYFSKWLPKHNTIMIRTLGQYIDKPISEVRSANYAFTLAGSPFVNNLPPLYVMRGYKTAQFLGKNLANYSLEYRFPIHYLYKGAGTTPLFLKRIHAALVGDGVTVEGYSYNENQAVYRRVNTWDSFWSAGAELKLDITLGYHFPMTFMVGAYKAFNAVEGGESAYAINLQF